MKVISIMTIMNKQAGYCHFQDAIMIHLKSCHSPLFFMLFSPKGVLMCGWRLIRLPRENPRKLSCHNDAWLTLKEHVAEVLVVGGQNA